MNSSYPANKLLLDVSEACAILGIGRSKLYSYILSGRLKSVTLGRRRKIAIASLHEFIRTLYDEQLGES